MQIAGADCSFLALYVQKVKEAVYAPFRILLTVIIHMRKHGQKIRQRRIHQQLVREDHLVILCFMAEAFICLAYDEMYSISSSTFVISKT